MAEESKSASEWQLVGEQATARQLGFPETTETVTLSVASATSTATFLAGTHVRVVSDVDSWMVFGTTATNAGFPLFAKQPVLLFIKVESKISGIAGGAGKLYLSKMVGA